MNQPTKCPGRKVIHPLFPFWESECVDCARRVATLKNNEVRIDPWTGHGPCPDKVELNNENP